MRQFSILIIFSIVMVACFGQSKKQNAHSNERPPAQLYAEFCASCHGQKVEAFVDRRNWEYGDDKASIVKVIAFGADTIGMPAYQDQLTQAETESLADFILNAKDYVDGHSQETVSQLDTSAYKQELVTDVINSVWGIDQLPDSTLLCTDKEGKLWQVKDGLTIEITGVPDVYYKGQAGLMDVCLHPQFKENKIIYLSYSKPHISDQDKSTTAVYRARLENNTLVDGKDIFVASPYHHKQYHYGCRLQFDNAGYLFISVGERGNRDVFPQDITNSNGKVHRVKDDGSIPDDNPFVGQTDIGSIWSYGHRNPQGLCYDSKQDILYEHEHGPRGGDELNLIKPSVNYGWPVISYGINYSGTTFTDLTSKEGMEQPLRYWVPSIAPCGMEFITSDKYPEWQGDILTGSLKYDYVARTDMFDDGSVGGDERLFQGIGRVRSIHQGIDGYIYVGLEEPGKLVRIVPKQ